MADNVTSMSEAFAGGFKEAVCIDADRIYDSCSDKDCLEDLQVYFPAEVQNCVIDQAISVKCKKVRVLYVFIDVEPVPFNKGFYSVDMTYYFEIKVDVFNSPVTPPTTVCGFASFSKKVILYGSEGNVRVFSSDASFPNSETTNMPTANVQVVDPICLSSNLCEYRDHFCPCPIAVPPAVAANFGGEFGVTRPNKVLLVTLGLFSIVQIERKVQMLIPAYDFCVPDKECVTTTDDPCELFKRIKFPVDEFFPPRLSDEEDDNIPKPCCG